ncbi:MAG: DUF2344 domain-containing protein [Ruthenibacterium sp.]
MFNRLDHCWCERVFAPAPDMEEKTRENHIPLEVYALKSVRIWFDKFGSAKYISYLDLCHCTERVIYKTKLPCGYTESPKENLRKKQTLTDGVKVCYHIAIK